MCLCNLRLLAQIHRDLKLSEGKSVIEKVSQNLQGLYRIQGFKNGFH